MIADYIYLRPCPFCGNDLNKQDPEDTIYPATKSGEILQIVCGEYSGGCGATILGRTEEETEVFEPSEEDINF